MTDEGSPLVRLSVQVSAGHSILTGIAVLVDGAIDIPFAVVSSILFFVGTALSALGLWNGIQRSRVDDVSLAGLVAIDTRFVPKRVRNILWAVIVGHTTITIIAATQRLFTAQAFGLLAPMFGLGVALVWASRHATFARRTER